jgi:hypothetical protein
VQPEGFVVYRPLSEAEVREVAKRTVNDDPGSNFEHHWIPIYNYHVREDRPKERFHPSDWQLFSDAGIPSHLKEGVACWPEIKRTEFKKHLLFRDTIGDLGYQYKETRDYFYILQCLDKASKLSITIDLKSANLLSG